MEQVNSNSIELQEVNISAPIALKQKPNDFPHKHQFSCSHTCSFSNREFNKSDAAERSKTTFKLCGLIFFYTILTIIEIFGGLRANSLAILTDAAHLFSDIAGFSISLLTVWVSGWKATPSQSFGFHRVEVIGALLSIQLIWLISATLIYEAIERLTMKNTQVNGKLMSVIAAFGFAVNLFLVLWLGHNHDHSHHSHSCQGQDHNHNHNHDHEMEEEKMKLVLNPHEGSETLNINIQGAYLHLVTDLIQSVGVVIAGLVIWLKPEWLVVDLICTLIFSTIALSTTVPMLKNVFSILMERVPNEIDIGSLVSDLKLIKGVIDVHDVHVWAITVGKNVLACHVVIGAEVSSNEILNKIREYCEVSLKIHHVTVQVEQELCVHFVE